MTTAGYVPEEGSDIIDESCEMVGQTVYAKTKIEAEKVLLEKCNAVSLRLASVYGASSSGIFRQDTFVNHFIMLAIEKRTIEVFQANQRRDIVHVADVGRAFLHALEHYPWLCGRAFNVGEANITKGQVAQRIKSLDAAVRIEEVAGEDPDHRDFWVDHKTWINAGFEYHYDFRMNIRQEYTKQFLGAR